MLFLGRKLEGFGRQVVSIFRRHHFTLKIREGKSIKFSKYLLKIRLSYRLHKQNKRKRIGKKAMSKHMMK